MRDNALQLVALQQLEHAAGHGDRSITRRKTRSKRIDAAFFLQYIYFRNGNAGRDRHFLDHIAQLSAQWIIDVRRHQRTAHILCNPATARRKTSRLVQRGSQDKECGNDGGEAKNGGIRRVVVLPDSVQADTDYQGYAGDDQNSRDDIDHHQPAGGASCPILCVKEIHDRMSGCTSESWSRNKKRYLRRN